MASEVIMPQMGFDMKEGTLVRWIKREGDEVASGEIIAEIETDKAVVEIEAFDSGVLRQTLIDEGTTVPVGEVIAVIAAADERGRGTAVAVGGLREGARHGGTRPGAASSRAGHAWGGESVALGEARGAEARHRHRRRPGHRP